MKTSMISGWAAALSLGLSVNPALGEEFDGVEFPQGEASFADRVVSFEPGDGEDIEAPFDDPALALGVPDFIDNETPKFVSLGNVPADGRKSELVLEFTDNRLVDVDGNDLYVFEVGSVIEPTELAISTDGQTWIELGRIEGSTRGVDLANYPEVPTGSRFRYARLSDVPGSSSSGAPSGGPDIDALGAIGSDVSDGDEDGIHDDGDNCPDDANADQADGDTDAVGNVCDACPEEPGVQAEGGCPIGAGGAGGEAGTGPAGGAGAAQPAGGQGGTPAAGGGNGGTTAAGAGSGGSYGAGTGGGGSPPTAGAESGGSAGRDPTAGEAGDDDGSGDSESKVSCQCRMQPASGSGAFPFALSLLALVAVLRRRARAASA